MHALAVKTDGVVVSPLQLIDEKTGLYVHFKAFLNGIDECDCLAFGLLGIEIMRVLSVSDQLELEGMLYILPDNSRRLYVFEFITK